MRKLEVPKSGWIRSAKVDFVKEGLMKGALHVEIDMHGDATRGSFEDVAMMVEQMMSVRLPARRIVRFTGQLVDHDANFMLLVKSLYDYGFELQCVIGDGLVYVWLQWMSWVIVRSARTVILSACDEVWLVTETLPEDVTIPIRAQRPTFCFVTGKLDVTDVDAFMCRSRHQWALL
jgi:hypothetical protein